MTTVDTTTWIDFFRGIPNPQSLWLRQENGRRRLGILDLVLCEVLQGTKSEAEFERVKSKLLAFEIFDTGGREMALAAARNYKVLRSRGITVRTTIDCMIATYCIEHGHSLLHNDRDFDPFETHLGLKVVRPGVVSSPIQ